MPHANADVDRLFSNLKVVVRILTADSTLLKLVADVRADYEKRMKNVKDEGQAKKIIESENRLAEEVAAAKSKIQDLCASVTTTEQAIEKKFKEKRRAQSLLETYNKKRNKRRFRTIAKEQMQKRKNPQKGRY